MKVIHRIGLRVTASQRRELEALGVKVPAGLKLPDDGEPLAAFDVSEDHPRWPALAESFSRWRVSDLVRTEFTAAEIAGARWSAAGAWHYGYPQPKVDEFGYLAVTYDLTRWCEACGAGKAQKAPFLLKGEPKWGRNGMLQLTWVYDELFVTPSVWTLHFEPHNVPCRPVLDMNAMPLKTVVQLEIRDEVRVSTSGLPSETCRACGREKWLPVTRGGFPSLMEEPPGSAARTVDEFGSGGESNRRVLLSRAIVSSLTNAGVCGPSFTPVID